MPHADPAGFVLLGLSVAFIIAIRLINEVATYISAAVLLLRILPLFHFPSSNEADQFHGYTGS